MCIINFFQRHWHDAGTCDADLDAGCENKVQGDDAHNVVETKNEVNCAYPVNQTGIVEEPTEEFPRVFEGAHV